MPALVPDVQIYAGDTVTFPEYQLKESDGVTPVDLSAYTNWKSEWVSRDGTIRVDLDVDISNVAAGIIVITASATATRTMGGAGRWDVQAEQLPEVRTFFYGKTVYVKDVTGNGG